MNLLGLRLLPMSFNLYPKAYFLLSGIGTPASFHHSIFDSADLDSYRYPVLHCTIYRRSICIDIIIYIQKAVCE
uniref:Uncharacterized protein n=1 Tax=Utricularia reniformis TaxID=192314 RepID=A0A1Y0B4G1_9LAMI|nr:hypothetical protein AEK19_MT2129 [Utricularia reniformis]ART32280.1 hypothetical protein AEK19_MT2129 [Utricularia reniformis]